MLSRTLSTVLFLALLAPQPALAQEGEHWSLPLRRQLARVNAVDWRIATAAAPYCQSRSSGFGLAFDTLGAYPEGERTAIVAATGMRDAPQIIAVAPGSPGETAGILAGDDLVAINGRAVSKVLESAGEVPAPDYLVAVLSALPLTAVAELTVLRAGQTVRITLQPQARCKVVTRLVIDDGVTAYSGDGAVGVSMGLVAMASDEELALATGHEFAHEVLHPDPKRVKVGPKVKEDQADLYGARLARCAGYDIRLANRFWARFDAARLLGFLPTLTHRKGTVRDRQIAALPPDENCAALVP